MRIVNGDNAEVRDYPADSVKRLSGRKDEKESADLDEEFIETPETNVEDESLPVDDE